MTTETEGEDAQTNGGDAWVSAYLDDEMTPGERHQSTRRLCREQEARLRLGRYQLIGDAIRGDLPEHLEAGFSGQVLQVLAREQEQVASDRHWGLRELWYWLWHPGPSVALSGALSVLVIAGLWLYMDGMPEDASRVEASAHAVPMSEEAMAQAQERQRILHSYLAAHAQAAAPPAMIPYIQLVDYVE